MPKKVKISPEHYPSDKDIYDLVMSKNVTPRKVQELLRDLGIFVPTRSRRVLATILSSIRLDEKGLQALLKFANVRENRTKTSTVELNETDVNPNELCEELQNLELPESLIDQRVKLVNGTSRPTFDKDTKTIRITQKFKKIDYSRATMLQEEDHEFTVTITPTSKSSFKILYSTSDSGSEGFFKGIQDHLKYSLEQKGKKEAYFHEIILSELPLENINPFFERLIYSKGTRLKLEHVKKVMMVKGTNEVPDESSEESDEENEGSNEERLLTTEIKHLRFEGRNLLNHEDVKRYANEGYFIRSLSGIFVSAEMGLSHFLEISVGFGVGNKFLSEISSAEVLAATEQKKDRINLAPNEKENYLRPINDEAFAIYEQLRKSEQAGQSPDVTGMAAIEPALEKR